MNTQISLTRQGAVATIQIQRPEALNALSREIVDQLDIYLDEIKADPSIRVLLFYSQENFAAGADIKAMSTCDEAGAKAFLFTPVYNKVQTLSIPTIAVIDGYAFGGGLELALRCDFRIVSENALLGLTELNLGIIPGAGGTIMLPRLVGEAKAKELIYLSRTVKGPEAERIGLANICVSKEDLLPTAEKWASKLCTRSARSLSAAKASIEYGIGHPELFGAGQFEGDIWADLFNYEDQKEGMAAFIEKRKPQYTGK